MKIGGVRSYPKEIVVGDQVWTIHFARCLEDKPLKPARNGKKPKQVVGYCDPSDCTIWILLGQGPLETFSTFLHEVQHCFEFEGEIDIPHKVIYKTELWWAKFIIENCLEINNVVFSGEYYRGRGNAFQRPSSASRGSISSQSANSSSQEEEEWSASAEDTFGKTSLQLRPWQRQSKLILCIRS